MAGPGVVALGCLEATPTLSCCEAASAWPRILLGTLNFPKVLKLSGSLTLIGPEAATKPSLLLFYFYQSDFFPQYPQKIYPIH